MTDEREHEIHAHSRRQDYVGFWLRVVAHQIDWILVGVLIWIGWELFGLQFFVVEVTEFTEIGGDAQTVETNYSPNYWTYLLAMFVFAFFESSPLQATPGKLLIGAKAVNLSGERLGFGQALLRQIGKIASSVLLGIGYLMVGFTHNKQGLHDRIASTLVVRRR